MLGWYGARRCAWGCWPCPRFPLDLTYGGSAVPRFPLDLNHGGSAMPRFQLDSTHGGSAMPRFPLDLTHGGSAMPRFPPDLTHCGSAMSCFPLENGPGRSVYPQARLVSVATCGKLLTLYKKRQSGIASKMDCTEKFLVE
jgi:hypothetical protein